MTIVICFCFKCQNLRKRRNILKIGLKKYFYFFVFWLWKNLLSSFLLLFVVRLETFFVHRCFQDMFVNMEANSSYQNIWETWIFNFWSVFNRVITSEIWVTMSRSFKPQILPEMFLKVFSLNILLYMSIWCFIIFNLDHFESLNCVH